MSCGVEMIPSVVVLTRCLAKANMDERGDGGGGEGRERKKG